MGDSGPAEREIFRDVIGAQFLFGGEKHDDFLPGLVRQGAEKLHAFVAFFRRTGDSGSSSFINMFNHIYILAGLKIVVKRVDKC